MKLNLQNPCSSSCRSHVHPQKEKFIAERFPAIVAWYPFIGREWWKAESA